MEENRTRDTQLTELLETLKSQTDQVAIFLSERPRIAELEQEIEEKTVRIRDLQEELIPVVSSKRSADPIPTIYPQDPRAYKTDIYGALTTPTSSSDSKDGRRITPSTSEPQS